MAADDYAWCRNSEMAPELPQLLGDGEEELQLIILGKMDVKRTFSENLLVATLSRLSITWKITQTPSKNIGASGLRLAQDKSYPAFSEYVSKHNNLQLDTNMTVSANSTYVDHPALLSNRGTSSRALRKRKSRLMAAFDAVEAH